MMIRNNILLVAVTLLGASMVFKCDNDKLYKIIADLQAQLKAKDDRINAMLTDAVKQNIGAANLHKAAIIDLEEKKSHLKNQCR